MSARKFRKKPVVIEAMQYTMQSCHELHEWAGLGPHEPSDACRNGLLIPTLEGEAQAQLGDWIIKGVQGEFYPCKPDIFDATYEAVAE